MTVILAVVLSVAAADYLSDLYQRAKKQSETMTAEEEQKRP
jgi:hypothetical protein